MRTLCVVASAVMAVAGAGCTTASLERYTLNQIQSTVDYRYSATLGCLAAAAADPATLPSFAILGDGSTRVQDMGSLTATTSWTRAVGSFAAQTLGVTVSRSPQEQWTIAPVAEHTQLEAMRCACLWVLDGPERACAECGGILNSPDQDPTPGAHYGVADRLGRLPHGWLGRGSRKDVPPGACYKSHCGDTWVWVTSEGLRGLADFTLVLLDIATIDINHGATTAPPLVVTLQRFEFYPGFALSEPDWANLIKKVSPAGAAILQAVREHGPYDSVEDFTAALAPVGDDDRKLIQPVIDQRVAALKNVPYSTQLTFSEFRAVRPEFKPLVEQRMREALPRKDAVALSWDEWMTYTVPYHGTRTNVKPQGGIAQPTPDVGPSLSLAADPAAAAPARAVESRRGNPQIHSGIGGNRGGWPTCRGGKVPVYFPRPAEAGPVSHVCTVWFRNLADPTWAVTVRITTVSVTFLYSDGTTSALSNVPLVVDPGETKTAPNLHSDDKCVKQLYGSATFSYVQTGQSGTKSKLSDPAPAGLCHGEYLFKLVPDAPAAAQPEADGGLHVRLVAEAPVAGQGEAAVLAQATTLGASALASTAPPAVAGAGVTIASLGLPARAAAALAKKGVNTLSDLGNLESPDLAKIRDVTRDALFVLFVAMTRHDVKFRDTQRGGGGGAIA